MPRLRSVAELREERLQRDPVFRAEWERTALARAVALRVLGYRIDHGLTQTALAEILGMRQSAIARLELGEQNPRVETLLRLSEVLGMEFLLHVTPAGQSAPWPDPETATDTVREQVQAGKSAVLAAAR